MSFTSFESLPIELVDHIVEDVGYALSEPWFNAQDVRSCALVCRSLLPICRKYLFERIDILFNDKLFFRATQLENFTSLLQNSPEIAQCVRHLRLVLVGDVDEAQISPLSLIKSFSNLRSYKLIANFPQVFFNRLSPMIRLNLLPPIPTLTSLELRNIYNFPFHELPMSFPNIRDLRLFFMEAGVAENMQVQPIKLERYRCDCSVGGLPTLQNLLPVMDITGLKHLDMRCISDLKDMEIWSNTLQMLLQSNQLVTLTLYAELDLTGMGEALLTSRMTLKEIHISTVDSSREANHIAVNPMFSLCKELATLGRHPNALESLSYSLSLYRGRQCVTGDAWASLDRLVDSFLWPMLKTASITIEFNSSLRTDDAEVNDFLQRLEGVPSNHLPLLYGNSRKTLDFKFEVVRF